MHSHSAGQANVKRPRRKQKGVSGVGQPIGVTVPAASFTVGFYCFR